MTTRGRHDLSGWGSCIDGDQVSLTNKKDRAKNTRKQTKGKEGNANTQTKRTKSKQEKQEEARAERKANKIDECISAAS
jgi:hypothetical protein